MLCGTKARTQDMAEDTMVTNWWPWPYAYPGENISHVTEIANGVYSAYTVTANYVKFWFRRFCSGIFDVKDAPRTGRSVVENVDKITEIIEVDRHVSSRSMAQELKIDHKTVLRYLR
ncbi:histone-lysine N-methyltransferase SETMAR [Trichonephila clavipes]|nr:histone-lysine N-methyltransferase SETMAR [Trichonephila clavipes]